MAQWLELCAFTAKGTGSIPSQGTKILQATQHGQKKKKKNHFGYLDISKSILNIPLLVPVV